MKHSSLRSIACLALLALASGHAVVAADSRRSPDQSGAPRQAGGKTTDLTAGVHIASIYAEDRSLRRYAGKQLLNTEGAELGEIKDFIVHPSTSRVRYAVVSSGGVLGMGNSLRLVPVEALRVGDRNQIAVEILHAQWLQIPPVSDQDYVADRFQISPTLHEQLVQRFQAQPRAGREAPADARRDADFSAGLVRATVLRGKEVSANGRKVGDIENIILDLDRGMAAALLDAHGDFTGTRAKYLIPLSQLTYEHSNQKSVTTTLTRADFDRAQPSSFGQMASTDGAAGTTAARDERLTPTGRIESTRATTTSTSDALQVSMTAIRQTIQNDPSLSIENIHVSAEDGKVVLRGAVRNPAVKQQIENAARHAVPAGTVESRITVKDR